MENLYQYLATLLPLMAIDGIWITLMWQSFYSKQLAGIVSPNPSYVPATVFYLAYAAAIIFFVTLPSLKNDSSLLVTVLSGAFLGLIVYGAYDLTNQASIANWPLLVTVVDMAWGAFLTGLISLISLALFRIIG